MKNPFNHTSIVRDKAFCNRGKELKDLLKSIKASRNVLLYSHRRYGKTSLILKVFKQARKSRPKIDTMHIDLYGTLSERDFVSAVLAGLHQVESRMEKLAQMIKNALKNVKLGWNFDPITGTPSSVSLSIDGGYDHAILDNVMQLLKQLSEKRQLAVALDEFQEIALYRQDGFEKRLRRHIQMHQNISYIFCGSQQHILTEIFHNENRAFYKLATGYRIHKIQATHYVPWLQRLMKSKPLKLSVANAKDLISRCDNHPMYIQLMASILWEDANGEITVEDLEKAERNTLRASYLEFLNLWESLTINQRKSLKLLINTGGRGVFNASALQAVDLKSASQVSEALKVLIRRDIVRKNSIYHIQDLIFQKWIERLF